MCPHRIEHGLHIARRRGGNHYSVLFGQDDAKLSEGTVTAVAVAGHPELEAVALTPIRIRSIGVVDLPGGGVGYPIL